MAYMIEEAMARKAREKKTQNVPASPRVLVVDDNHTTVVAVSLMLEALGFETDAANCGTAALSCLNEFSYDVVLTDFDMPDMMGNALAARIKEKWPETGVVIMTGGNYEEIEDHAENGSIEHWIYKPFNMGALETLLEKVTHPEFNDVVCGHA